MSVTDFEIYGVCPTCDSKHYAPFGSLFHIHHEVCPHCGTDKNRYKLQTLRWKKTGFRKGHYETPTKATRGLEK